MNVGEILNVQLLYDILRVSTPLILLALAGAISDRGGVLNIALEGLLLFGAFAGVLATGLTRSLVVGVSAAMLAGVLLALVFAWFAIFLRANLFIVGLATNSFAAAVTTYASWLIAGREGQLRYPNALTLPKIDIPLIGDIGFLSFLSGHTLLDYVTWLLIPTVSYLMFRTKIGLRLRAVGEDANAARAVGLRVNQIKYLAIAASGLLAGLAGAHLALTLGGFVQDMSGGRGWVGLVAAIVGNATAWGSVAAAVLFGAAQGVANSLQITVRGIPTQLLFALPYLLTLVALVFYSASRRGKRADPLDE